MISKIRVGMECSRLERPPPPTTNSVSFATTTLQNCSHLFPADGRKELLDLGCRVTQVDHCYNVALAHVQAVLHTE